MAETAGASVKVSELHPMHLKEKRSASIKNSLRLHGSLRMNLKRPYRSPESNRPYIQGDPLAMIDWKAFGRTDQLIVREQRDEASASVHLAIEGCPSMSWTPNSQPPPKHTTKLEIACRIALHLAHLHLRMGDRVQLWLIKQAEEALPAWNWRPRGPSSILRAYQHLSLEGFTSSSLAAFFQRESFRQPNYDRGYWLGDGLSQLDFLGFLSSAKRPILFHTLSSLETDLHWLQDDSTYFDQAENSKEFQGKQLRHDATFYKVLSQWQAEKKKILREKHGEYFLVTDQTLLKDYLRFIDYLA